MHYTIIYKSFTIGFIQHMDGQKTQAPKARKDKKKNTETGLLLGQNTNIFSQLSATYLQSKESLTQEQTHFVNSTQIVEYHDANINRLIALLRKKADVTKAKAALELKQEISKMSEENVEEFISTFAHLFMEVVINEQSKQVIDEFVSMITLLLEKFRKVVVKEIATIYGPLLVINKANNINQTKVYSLLFNGTEQQLMQKAIILLLNKNVTKKFIIFTRVIIECEQSHKIGQQNFQRNCSSLLKVLKQLIKAYESITDKKQDIKTNFARFILEINEIVSSKFVQQYFKIGGRAKSSFLEFYQCLISAYTKHPQWDIDWQNYARVLCQNYLDKDPVVQQALWKHCNRQFIVSTLQLEEQQSKQKQKQKQKEKYWLLHKYLPKPDQKLLNALKIGGLALYKELPSYCTIFPYTKLEQTQSHKSIINKITFIRKLIHGLLQLEDENQARVECYYQTAVYLISTLRNVMGTIQELDEKKQQQVRTLANKAEKEIVNNLQDRFYKSPPTSRNSFSFTVPTFFSKLLEQTQPHFDFLFDQKQTFPLYCSLKTGKNSEYVRTIYDKIFDNCKNNQGLLVQYLEHFPSKDIDVDMSDKNDKIQQASKIFLLSPKSQSIEKWFGAQWDTRKKLIVFDPRITSSDLKSFHEQESSLSHISFKPNHRYLNNEALLINLEHDGIRFEYFLTCLQDEQEIMMTPYMMPLIRDVILCRKVQNTVKFANLLLQVWESEDTKMQKKMWQVGENNVFKIKIVAELLFQALRTIASDNKDHLMTINQDQLKIFLSSYCQFVLTIYNYKLETESQQLLKLLPKTLHIQSVGEQIFASVQSAIKVAYSTFARSSNVNKAKEMSEVTVKQGEEKQRKNRLIRLVNFIKKLLWYGVNKKKEEFYVELFCNLLRNEDWKYAQIRPDLWMIAEAMLEIMDQKLKRTVSKVLISGYEQHKHFIALLMCCQLVLPLQRHPSTKKVILDLQNEVVRVLKQNDDESNLKILSSVLSESIENSSLLMLSGVKNLVKNLMKSYQNLSPQILSKYATICLQQPINSLKQQQKQQNYIRKCILVLNLCEELPLADLPAIKALYEDLIKLCLNTKESMSSLGYMAILSVMWNAGIGIDTLSTELVKQIATKFTSCIKQAAKQQKTNQTNFVRFCSLIFVNVFIQVNGRDQLVEAWDFIVNELLLYPVEQGSFLHGALQSARYRLISRIFTTCPTALQSKLVVSIPEELLKQVRFYKQILDQIEDQDQDQQKQENSSSSNQHYENIVNMFIQFAEVLVRITGNLSKQVRPREGEVLQLVQCPFAGVKKTSYMLLKQMYQLNLVERVPPLVFLSYLKINPDILKQQLDPLTANILSGYLYSWQAIIERRPTIQRPALSEQQTALTLEDYLQSFQLHENFLKNVLELLDSKIGYLKNEEEYELSAEELVSMDVIVTIEDEANLYNKIFRLTLRTLFMFVQNFPLFLRDFIDRNRKYRPVCERLLRNVISDAIFKQQIIRIQMREHEWKAVGNFEIYVIPKNKEIYAEYQHDVIRIGLRLLMKGNYPLTPIAIEFGQGLKIQEGSRWSLMLQTQLHSRNNTIINGILLWKQNIDKKLAGVEQCSICFDIVNNHGQLPKKGCKTCKKKFHSVCIMKWFNKSNKSECPLCKSQFI